MTQPDPSATADTETVPEAAPDTAADSPAAAEPAPEQPKPTETVDYWKARSRENEKRAKDNAAKAAEFDRVTEAQKSEQQKLIERAEAAEREATALRTAREIDKFKEDITKNPKYAGVPAHVLRGSTQEEIEEHAAELKALLPERRTPGQVPGEGRSPTPATGDPAQQFADILRNAQRRA